MHPTIPLRTLDALHVATCDLHRSGTLATTDAGCVPPVGNSPSHLSGEAGRREHRQLGNYNHARRNRTDTTAAVTTTSGGAYTHGENISKINVATRSKIIPRLLDVRDHFARVAGCARRLNPHNAASFSDGKFVAVPGSQAHQVRQNLRRHLRNYHPHGEAVIYPTLVHMAQPWAMCEKLVDGKGNFGSVENDRRRQCVTPKRD